MYRNKNFGSPTKSGSIGKSKVYFFTTITFIFIAEQVTVHGIITYSKKIYLVEVKQSDVESINNEMECSKDEYRVNSFFIITSDYYNLYYYFYLLALFLCIVFTY